MKRIQINWSQMSTFNRIALIASIFGIISALLTIYQCFHSSGGNSMQINAPNSGTQYLIQQPQNCQFITSPEQGSINQEIAKNFLEQISELKNKIGTLNGELIERTSSITAFVLSQSQEIEALKKSAEKHFENKDFYNALIDYSKVLSMIDTLANNKKQLGVQYEINSDAAFLLNIEAACTALFLKQFDVVHSILLSARKYLGATERGLPYVISLEIVYDFEMAEWCRKNKDLLNALHYAEHSIETYERAVLAYDKNFAPHNLVPPELLYARATQMFNLAMQPERALERAEQSLKYKWSSYGTKGKAIALINQGKVDEAINFLTMTLKEHPDDLGLKDLLSQFLKYKQMQLNGEVVIGTPPSMRSNVNFKLLSEIASKSTSNVPISLRAEGVIP